MKQIFLISGLAQHGKDSLAFLLKEKLPGKSLILHNADYLKYIAKQYLDWNGEKNDYGRTLLQNLGTEKIRIEQKRPLYWIERTCDMIEFLQNDFDYFLVADTRYKNEIFFPKSKFVDKVYTVRVHRFNFDSGLSAEQKNHISEIELVNFPHDYNIYSESGLDKLEIEVDKFLKILEKEGIKPCIF